MKKETQISVFMDFDGTITERDTLQYLLDTHSGEDWRAIERRVERGELEEGEALQMEMDLLEVPLEEALRSIEKDVEVDPHFFDFLDWCREGGIETAVVSGGFSTIIRHLLPAEIRDGLPILANELDVQDRRWLVVPRGNWTDCRKCNHCKRTAVLHAKRAGRTTVYVGNGNTDICPARVADVVIARDRLAEAMADMGRDFFAFEDFRDVQRHMIEVLERTSPNCTNQK